MSVLVLVGSLRADSFNSRLAAAIIDRLPTDVPVEHFDLSSLPYFSEDLEADPPAQVTVLRAAIERADVTLLATPEYNGSMPGLVKNALDWASRPHRQGAFARRPVAVVTASASPGAGRGAHAQATKLLDGAGADVLAQTVNIGRGYETFTATGSFDADTTAAIEAVAAALTGATTAAVGQS